VGLVFARCWVLRDRARLFELVSYLRALGSCNGGSGLRILVPFLTFVGGGGGYRPYFENYTVDASILDSTERSDHINNNNFLQQ